MGLGENPSTLSSFAERRIRLVVRAVLQRFHAKSQSPPGLQSKNFAFAFPGALATRGKLF